MTDITQTLKERGNRYGKFTGHAEVTTALKNVIHIELLKREKILPDDMTEALHMICHKIGRIINGDENYVENFRDIAGYATLVVDRLKETNGATDVKVISIIMENGEWKNECGNQEAEFSA